ncbi:MAG TPA: GNAT family N-acetyltransferase [Anaerolineales bacterium]|nr:GNAT family N-acetyltransferase [Anaerolineales bacterium]
MAFTIRPAREEDQETIVSFIHQANLNPRSLNWQNFLVAEENGQLVGVRQVKVYSEGTREVASGFVLPEYRRQGISAQLMNALLARETGPLYTMVNEKRAPYYEQFGFQRVEVSQLPSDFRKEYWIGRVVTTLLSLFSKERIRIIPLKREPS